MIAQNSSSIGDEIWNLIFGRESPKVAKTLPQGFGNLRANAEGWRVSRARGRFGNLSALTAQPFSGSGSPV